MLLVKMKDKGQVTIPASVRDQVDAHTGDLFEVEVVEGNIVLRPRDIIARGPQARTGVNITQWIGAGKGTFETPDQVDAFIRSERAQWD